MYLIPDVCVSEVATAAWRYSQDAEGRVEECDAVMRDLKALEPVVFGSADLVDGAFRLDADLTIAARLYVVLAQRWGVPLCTLDPGQTACARGAGVRVVQPGAASAEEWPKWLAHPSPLT